MNFLKYIITINNEPILFSRNLFHNEITVNAISAGFIKMTFDDQTKYFNVTCFGESTTLQLQSSPAKDKEIIENFLNEISPKFK